MKHPDAPELGARMRRKIAAYEMTRVDGRVRAEIVYQDGERATLPHLMYHSPDGFEYGYGGSGPSDLARSIVGHAIVCLTPSGALYQLFKERFISCAPQERPLRIDAEEARAWLVQAGVVPWRIG